MKYLIAFLLACFFSAESQAQLFSRFRSSCPGGVCPTSVSRTREVNVNRGPVASGVDRSLIEQHNALHGGGGDWTWPGGTEESLVEHLRVGHGQTSVRSRSVTRTKTSGSPQPQQSASSQLRVGGRDHDGALIMSIGVSPAPIPRSVPVKNSSAATTFGL